MYQQDTHKKDLPSDRGMDAWAAEPQGPAAQGAAHAMALQQATAQAKGPLPPVEIPAQGAAAGPAAPEAAPAPAAAPAEKKDSAETSTLKSSRFAGHPLFTQVLAGGVTLRAGCSDRGAVMVLQEALNALGYDCGAVDGVWGGRTSAALRAFQSQHGLSADAVIGPRTMAMLDLADAGSGGKAPPTPATPEHKPPTPDSPSPSPGQPPERKDTQGHDGQGSTSVPSPEQEKAFEDEATQVIAALRAKGGAASAGGGHTDRGAVASLPRWFSELQDLLIESRGWSETEEQGQRLLERYATARMQSGHPLPASVLVFLRYIGRSEANDTAQRKGKFRRANDLGGYEGSSNWCQQASTMAATKALEEMGLAFNGGYGAWLNRRSKIKGVSRVEAGRGAHSAHLEPGDIFSLISAQTPPTGHVATCIEDQGETILNVSGNAGGGGGAVRLGEARRGVPPDGYSYDRVCMAVNNHEPLPAISKPPPGEIWVVTIQRVGHVLEELEQLKGMDRNSPDFLARISELDLVLKK